MRRLDKIQDRAGFVLLLLGAGGADSENMVLPTILLIVALAFLYFYKEK